MPNGGRLGALAWATALLVLGPDSGWSHALQLGMAALSIERTQMDSVFVTVQALNEPCSPQVTADQFSVAE